MPTGDSAQVRVGPGWLYLAPLGSPEPSDLASAWDDDWVQIGYTDDGSSFVFDQTFEDVTVAEEYDPIDTLQTARQIAINFAAAELTAENLQTAFNGGTISAGGGLVTFEPPDAGDYTPVMLGWEATDGLERWVFRRCVQVGSVEIPRRRAPQKAVIPMSFRANKPTGDAAFLYIGDDAFSS